MTLQLVIANKNISSWSMRPWVLLVHAGIPFEEVFVPFGAPDWKTRVASPSGRVPLLIADGLHIWDSLAIAEHVNELFPEKQLWPADAKARAVARSVSSEMHSSFPDLRSECSMNLLARIDKALSARAQADVRRVDALFADCRARFGQGGDFLFGNFSIADAMFAPVASRVRTYGLELSDVSSRYVDALWSLPVLQRWAAEAKAEVDAGIVDPVSHGALFSRGEAEQFAKSWIDRLNTNDIAGALALCAENAQARSHGGPAALRGEWTLASRGDGAPLELLGCAWDGDVNQLAVRAAREGQHRLHLLSFDAAGLVSALETFHE